MICRPARERFPGVVSEAERDLIAPLCQALRHKPVVIRSERAVYDLGELLASCGGHRLPHRSPVPETLT